MVETTNFDERISLIGRPVWASASGGLTLTERFSRLGPNIAIDDPTVWTRPWTAMFRFNRDDGQYELAEHGRHDGSYSVTGVLSGGGRTVEARAEESAR